MTEHGTLEALMAVLKKPVKTQKGESLEDALKRQGLQVASTWHESEHAGATLNTRWGEINVDYEVVDPHEAEHKEQMARKRKELTEEALIRWVLNQLTDETYIYKPTAIIYML